MGKLPFVIEPRLEPIIERFGTEESGILEVRRQGYLSVAERNFVQQVQRRDSSTQLVIKLSRRIGSKYQLSLDKSYLVAMAALGGEQPSEAELHGIVEQVEKEFTQEISETITELASLQSQTELLEALCMIINRVDSSYDPSGITSIHPDLISALSKLYQDELNKSTERLKDLKDTTISVDEIEKKPAARKKSG